MFIIIAAVLAIALLVLIARTIREESSELAAEIRDFLRRLFSKSTVVDATDDFKHIAATYVKAFKQILRATGLVVFWLSLPLILILLPIAAALALVYLAYTK